MTANSTSGQPHVIVIGGGFGGIAAALRCRAMGAKVTLVERLERLGGRAQVFEVDGFKHDAGPTVITDLPEKFTLLPIKLLLILPSLPFKRVFKELDNFPPLNSL